VWKTFVMLFLILEHQIVVIFNLTKRKILTIFLFYIFLKNYQALLYNIIKSSFVTSLGFPGLHGSTIALSASISKSSFLAPTSFTVCVIPTSCDRFLIHSQNVFITSSFVNSVASICIAPVKIFLYSS